MVSLWWVAAAFLLGGFAGSMVFALMAVAAREHEHAARADEKLARDGLGPVELEATWSAK